MTPEVVTGMAVTVALLVLSLLLPSRWRQVQSGTSLWVKLALVLLIGLLLYRLLTSLWPLYRMALVLLSLWVFAAIVNAGADRAFGKGAE